MSSSTLPDIRLLLVGHTGHGKSSTANSITGQPETFKTSRRHQGMTERGQWKKVNRFGRVIEVVDTPGICDPRFNEETIKTELFRAVALTVPKVSAIAFVLRPTRITDETLNTITRFTEWFGNDIKRFTFVIVTFTTNKEELDEFLGESDSMPDCLKLMDDKALPIENRWLTSASRRDKEALDDQVQAIIAQIDKLNPTGDAFTNDIYEETKRYVKQSEALVASDELTGDIDKIGTITSEPTNEEYNLFKEKVSSDEETGFFSRLWAQIKRFFWFLKL